MNNTQHTPGPWHYAKATKQIFTPFGEILRVSGISVPCGRVDPDDECFANARLIAAAPELLEALVSAQHMLTAHLIRSVGTCDHCGGMTPNGTLKICRKCGMAKIESAIAKATGQTSLQSDHE